MIVDCISDLHGFEPELPGGDLLIVSGDLTARDLPEQHFRFEDWLYKQNYLKKIVIAGNHDGFLVNRGKHMFGGSEYLEDSGLEFQGFKIWGSPWTPTYHNWNFMKDRGEEIKKVWDLIPEDTEILITHGPPFGILDEVRGKHEGCEELRKALERLKKLKLHVFGHIHEGYGKVTINGVLYANASLMNALYNPINKPIRVVL